MSKLFMLIGLPGSGKSTYAKELSRIENANIHSSDSIRKELLNDINSQDSNNIVFKTLHNRIKKDLENGENCIYDATNINYKRRMEFLKTIKYIKDVEKIAIMLVVPIKDCYKQNELREREVPKHVIDKMYYNFYVPQYFEGWNNIILEYGDISNYNRDAFYKNLDIEQHNPHHTKTVLNHCISCAENVMQNSEDNILGLAALLHDCGKPVVKSFIDRKGKVTSKAHYYNHQYVGAYDSLLYSKNDKILNDRERLEIAKYIQFHMIFYNDINDKTINKYKKLLGSEFYSNLELLHEADMNAK